MLATIRGDGPGAALFTRASALVRSLQIRSDTDLEPLLQSPPADADEGVLRQLRYMAEAGSWVLRESAIADLPADLRWLYESGAVTIEQLATLHSTLGVTSAADLLAELRRMNIQRLPGFHPGLEASIAAALPGLRLAIPRISLARAVAIADPILDCLVQTPGVDSPTPVGSFRRGEDMVGDIEIVAPTADPAAALDAVAGVAENARVLHRSARRLYIRTDRVQVGVRCPSPDTAGAALLHLTGNGGHIGALRRMAADRGWSLDPEGLRSAEDRAPVADSEEAIYEALGLPWIPPEIRNGDEEIAAAKSGTLPALVSWRDIRGDLHMHTEWSDGRNTTEEMVRGCIALGYEYMAITDHSPHASSSRNLSVEGVKQQSEEIAGLRQKYPQITILHGCEVDILPNGRLDFSDRILESLDIVLASLHEESGHSRDRLFERYLAAMRHPMVTMITHPTNRQLTFRPPYDVDYDQLFAAAAETGTILEIDGSPTHLDLNGALARRAIAAGATVGIDSDCHRAERLRRQMELGVLLARHGWVEPRHVFNARPIDEIRDLIAAKRRR